MKLLFIFLFSFLTLLYADKTALIVIDVQRCFIANGTLPVANGDEVIPIINGIRQKYEGSLFDLVVFSQDWHCSDHVSFASQHLNASVFSNVDLNYTVDGSLCYSPDLIPSYSVMCNASDVAHVVSQTLWPDHCVINTTDADFAPGLDKKPTDPVIQKGYRCQVDSYSAFFDNGGFFQTNLQDVLTQNGINRVFVTGLALDFCVFYTSVDANKLNYTTYVILDATRGIANSTIDLAIATMQAQGITFVNSTDLDQFSSSTSSGQFSNSTSSGQSSNSTTSSGDASINMGSVYVLFITLFAILLL